MAHRGNARLLAPLALVGSVLAVAVVAGSSLGGDDSQRSGDAGSRGASRNQGAGKARTTVVKSGDTPSAIAQREGVSLDRLLELNPRIADPRKLHAGDRLKLGP